MNTTPNKEEEEKIEIEVVDDTPPEDQGRPRRPDGAEPELPDDDEIAGYSESVQKRIKRLKYEFHEERRQKEAAQRERDEAAALAAKALKDAEAARTNMVKGDSLIIEQAKARVTAQLAEAHRSFKEAYEAGDADALVKAQDRLTELKHEEMRLKAFRPQQPAPQAPSAPQAPQTTSQSQTPSVPKPSPRAEGWAQKNPWFGKEGHEDMTAQAFVAHERAIKSGIAPDSDEYYSAIDRAVRTMFPDRFQDADQGQPQRSKPGVVVAPASRQSSQNPRRVVLTQTQVSLAKRLGLTVEQYAAQLLKEQKPNG